MFKIHFIIEKKIIIDCNIDELQLILTDFNQWNKWSPWLCLDEGATTRVSNPAHQIGHSQIWNGNLIGSGEMILSKISANEIEMDLFFKKPFKSHAPAWFKLKAINQQTEITWGVKNSLPFFLFFIKKHIAAMMESSFAQGLIRLKELCESKNVNSTLSATEEYNQSELYYLGEQINCSFEEIPEKITMAYNKIFKAIEEKIIPPHDGMICVYGDCNLITGILDFTAAVFYKNKPNENAKTIPAHRALKLISKGPYHHLPTAWSKIITYQRGNKIKVNSKLPRYEFYLNNPRENKPEDYLTELRLPIK